MLLIIMHNPDPLWRHFGRGARCQKGSWQLWAYNRVFGNICHVPLSSQHNWFMHAIVHSHYCCYLPSSSSGSRGICGGCVGAGWLALPEFKMKFSGVLTSLFKFQMLKTFATIDTLLAVCACMRAISHAHIFGKYFPTQKSPSAPCLSPENPP